MKKNILVLCIALLSLMVFSTHSFSFVYYIDEFIQNNGTATFHDTFTDGNEPPSGPYSDYDYWVMGGLGNNSENNGFLELDDPDQELFLINSAYSLQTGSGGHISAAIQVDDHYWCNTAIGVQIVNSEEDGDQAFVGIKVIGEDGNIRAYWGDENVSYTEDIKSAVGADKKITVQLSIDTLNSVTAMWDYGSDGTFELVKTNLSQLNFITDSDYSGALGMWSAGANYDPYDENANLVIGDFELLHAIDDWATSLLGDFALLNLIDYWAAGSYC